MKIFLEVNETKPNAVDLRYDIVKFIKNDFNNRAEIVEDISDCDLILTLGGDGTILRAWQQYHHLDKLLWGINCGNLGYMTECDTRDWKEKLSIVLEGNFKVNRYMTLQGDICLGDKVLYHGIAMNDVVLHRVNCSVVHFNIRVDNQYLAYMNADGLVCSSPLGCTGYAISCGGAFIDPRTEMFQLIAIAPHNLMDRSIMISKDSEIQVQIPDERQGIVQFDGLDSNIILDSNYVLKIRKGEEYLNMVSIDKGLNFVSKIAKTFTFEK